MKILTICVLLCCIYATCGFSQQLAAQPVGKSENSSKIILGQSSIFYKFKFTVRLRVFRTKLLYIICSGSALTIEVILTAAHCLLRHPLYIKITVGKGSFSDKYPPDVITEYKSDEYLFHPDFNATTLEYDVALIGVSIISQGLNFELASLPKMNDALPAPGEYVTLVGWGSKTGFLADISDTLNSVMLPIIYHTTCANKFGRNFKLTSEMFCAGWFQRSKKNACLGDAGGPVVSSTGKLIGVISAVKPNCRNTLYPPVAISVPKIRDWITKITGFL